MLGKTFVLATAYDGEDILPHFISHYISLGVACVAVAVVRRNRNDDEVDAMLAACRSRDVKTVVIERPEFACVNDPTIAETLKHAAGVGRNDWLVPADLDEFHEYPEPISDVLARLLRTGKRAAVSSLLDRVSESGHLTRITTSPSLWRQYPLACRFTRKILQADVRKISLCHVSTAMDCAHHFPRLLPASAILASNKLVTHHFKWTESLRNRLTRRLTSVTQPKYLKELKILAAYLDKHGRILVENAKELEVVRWKSNRCST